MQQNIFMEGSQDNHLTTYTIKKLFVCQVCKKGFLKKRHLIRHRLTHMGINSHVCEICKKKKNLKNTTSINIS